LPETPTDGQRMCVLLKPTIGASSRKENMDYLIFTDPREFDALSIAVREIGGAPFFKTCCGVRWDGTPETLSARLRRNVHGPMVVCRVDSFY